MSDPHDDYDDLPPDPRPRARSGPGLVIALILTGAGLLVLVVCGGLAALLWARAAPVAPPVAATRATDRPARPSYTRAEFRTLVLGKTPDEVRAAVGEPQGTAEFGIRRVWHCGGVTRDPATGTLDADAAVVFEGGVAADVQFSPAPKGPVGRPSGAGP